MSPGRITRRHALKGMAAISSGVLLAACQPKVQEVERIVKETVIVETEKLVKETTVVEKEKVVEKEVTRLVPASQDITITFMIRADNRGDAARAFIPRFESENPGANVKTVDTVYGEIAKKTQAMYAAGNLPDLVWTVTTFFPMMAVSGIYAPLGDMLDAHWTEYGMDDFYPAALHALTLEGETFGIPNGGMPTSRPMVFFNIDMLEEAGIRVPDTNEWDVYAWRDAALALTKPEDKVFGGTPPNVRSYYDWDAFVDGFGANIVVDEVGLGKRFNWLGDAKVKEAWDWYESFAITGHGAPTRSESVQMGDLDPFSAGMVATFTGGEYHIAGFKSQIGDKFRWGATLMKGPAKRGSGMFVSGVSVSSKSPHPEETLKLAWYLTRAEVGIWSYPKGVGGALTPRREAWTNSDVMALHPMYPVYAEFWDEAQTPFPHPWNLRYQELYDTYSNLMDPMSYGEKDWATQAPIIQQKCQEVLDLPRP